MKFSCWKSFFADVAQVRFFHQSSTANWRAVPHTMSCCRPRRQNAFHLWGLDDATSATCCSPDSRVLLLYSEKTASSFQLHLSLLHLLIVVNASLQVQCSNLSSPLLQIAVACSSMLHVRGDHVDPAYLTPVETPRFDKVGRKVQDWFIRMNFYLVLSNVMDI